MGDIPAAASTAIQFDLRLSIVAVISVFGFFVSLISIWRSERNTKEARQNRDKIQSLEALHKKRLIQIEEFRTSVQGPLIEPLSRLRKLRRSFDTIAKTSVSLDETFNSNLKRLNSDTMDALGDTYDVLEDVNSSQFADGIDWLEYIDEIPDKVGDALNIALDDAKKLSERQLAISTVSRLISSLRTDVKYRLDKALLSFADASETTPSQLD